MKNILKAIIIFTLSFIYKSIKGQNVFNQFFNTPHLTNPANVGKFNRAIRINFGYKTSRLGNLGLIDSKTFAIDGKIKSISTLKNDFYSIGLSGLNETNQFEGISKSSFRFNASYCKSLNEEGTTNLVVGFLVTNSNQSLNKPPLVSESQINSWVRNGYNLDNIFNFLKVRFSYFDIGTGVVLESNINTKSSFSIGTYIDNAIGRQIFFEGGNLKIFRNYGIHFSYSNIIDEQKEINVTLLIQKSNKLSSINSGVNLSINATKLSKVYTGFIFKDDFFGTFIAPMAGLIYNNIQFVTSFNVPIKKIPLVGNSFETTLTFRKARTRDEYLEKKFINF